MGSVMRTITRLTAATTILVATGALGGITGAGSAAAAEPILIEDCKTTIQATPGTPLRLSPTAVVTPVVNVVKAVPLLGAGLAAPVEQAVRAMPPMSPGTVPNGGGYISGAQISDVVVTEISKLPVLGPILDQVVGGVQQALTTGCGITVQALNTVSTPVQDAGKQLVETSRRATQQLLGQQPGPKPGTPPAKVPQNNPPRRNTLPNNQAIGGNVPNDIQSFSVPRTNSEQFGWGRVPLYDYSDLPFAIPGMFAQAPNARYGQVPGYGYEGLNDQVRGGTDGVRGTGRVQALPIGSASRVVAPMLLAVLALATVTAALVRTWVLRRALGV